MFKKIYPALFLSISFFNQAISGSPHFRVIEKQPDRLILEWQAPALTWQTIAWQQTTMARPQMGSLPLSQDADRPGLPLDAYTLEIPSGYTSRVQLLDSVVTEAVAPYPIAPGYLPADSSNDSATPAFAGSSGYYPDVFLSHEVGRRRERNLLRVALYPMRYQAAGRRVRSLAFARLQITFHPQAVQKARRPQVQTWKPTAGQAMKLLITESAVYEVKGEELQAAGIALDGIVPSDLKLYCKGVEQPLALHPQHSDRLSANDAIRFYGERRFGADDYYDAAGDTAVYWLDWSPSPGRRYQPVAAGITGEMVDHLPALLHLEQNLTYYSGDTSDDIQNTEQVPGEGWVWAVINRDASFSLPFDLLHLAEEEDSVRFRLRLRGLTLDPHTPDHHVRIYVNQVPVCELFFNDREQVFPDFKVVTAGLKTFGNTLEIRLIGDTPSAISQIFLDWLEVSYSQRSRSVNGLYEFSGADLATHQSLFVSGFRSRPTVWDLAAGRSIDSIRIAPHHHIQLQVRSAGLSDGNHALFYSDGVELFRGSRGHNVVTLDGVTGMVLQKKNFDTYGSNAQSDSMAAFLNRQTDSTFVLIAVADDGSSGLTVAAKQAMQRLGGLHSGEITFRSSYALICRVGAPQLTVEALKLQGQGEARVQLAAVVRSPDALLSAQFSLPYVPTGRVVVFDSTAIRTPLRSLVYHGRDLTDSSLGADYIVITHPLFQSAADHIAEYRAQRNNFRTVVVGIEEVYDCFTFGLSGPQAIKAFLQHAYANWTPPRPAYVLLLGDASWDPHYHYGKLGQNNYIPAYGNPVSDLWFVCLDGEGDLLPDMSIGRWPVETVDEAEGVVQKLIDYEAAPSAAWKKEFLFISGGFTILDQASFRGQSAALQKDFVTPAPVSGHSVQIHKTSLDFIEGENRDAIMAALNNGTVWTNFIGHAASRTWDLMFHNADIDLLENAPRYPFITSMTCHTGRFAQPDQVSFGENFLLARGRGAIAFLGTSGWGYSYEDYAFLRMLLPKATRDSVRVLGRLVNEAKIDLWSAFGSSAHIRDMLLQYNLLGDPATQLALPTEPDLALMPDDIRIRPEAPSEGDSTADIQVRIRNYGLATRDSVEASIRVQHPTLGRSFVFNVLRPPLGLVDSTAVVWPLRNMTGAVDIQVVLDSADKIHEADESNNRQERRVTVLSSRMLLIAPQDRAMIPFDSVKIKIQNPQTASAADQSIEFLVDTTASFTSPLRRSSGPLSTQPLAIIWSPGTLAPDQLYYWQARDPAYPDEHPVLNGRFFSSGRPWSGWRQDLTQDAASADRQSVQGSDQGIQLNVRSFPLLVQSAGFSAGHYAVIAMQGEALMTTGRGYNVVVLDRNSARVIAARRFDTYGDAAAVTAMAEFLENVKQNQLVLIAISDDGAVGDQERFHHALESLGSRLSRLIQFRDSWAFIGFKGATAEQVFEQYQSSDSRVEAVVLDTLRLHSETGWLQTAAIGPAKRWDRIAWDATVPDSTWMEMVLWAADKNNNQVDTLLRSRAVLRELDLTDLPADRYPKIHLQARLGTLNGQVTPTLKQWQVHFLPAPDLAVAPAVLTQSKDTVLVGDTVTMTLQIHNLGLQPADSVAVLFQEYDSEVGYRTFARHLRNEPLAADSFWTVEQKWIAGNRSGLRTLLISVDPGDQINEVLETNNTVTATVYVRPDTTVPRILITYDDRKIVSGDLVAAKPQILISAFDNSPIAPDSSRITVWLDGKRIAYNDPSAVLLWQTPSSGASAVLLFTPALSDGDHALEVLLSDPSGNSTYERNEFRVESDLKLLQVMNYPNPFTNDTQITFEMTQPAKVSVRIYTVSGRMIRELENGDTAAGFAAILWDGRDADGDRPANGVYLYKVIASAQGEETEAMGKAVLIR
ncbi:MAG TPA: C25 family cysteine peptidase [bacterium]|nr:C25 family cysteine peptidase [bacterium]